MASPFKVRLPAGPVLVSVKMPPPPLAATLFEMCEREIVKATPLFAAIPPP
jgi:hypothetical protein